MAQKKLSFNFSTIYFKYLLFKNTEYFNLVKKKVYAYFFLSFKTSIVTFAQNWFQNISNCKNLCFKIPAINLYLNRRKNNSLRNFFFLQFPKEKEGEEVFGEMF